MTVYIVWYSVHCLLNSPFKLSVLDFDLLGRCCLLFQLHSTTRDQSAQIVCSFLIRCWMKLSVLDFDLLGWCCLLFQLHSTTSDQSAQIFCSFLIQCWMINFYKWIHLFSPFNLFSHNCLWYCLWFFKLYGISYNFSSFIFYFVVVFFLFSFWNWFWIMLIFQKPTSWFH